MRGDLAAVRPDWGLVLVASGLVLVGYLVLVGTWLLMLERWGARMPYGGAARIWFVSNLGRYIPGKVWQIAAMGAMAQRRGVSPVAATGSSLVVNLSAIVSGFAIVFLTGADLLRMTNAHGTALAGALTVLVLGGLLVLPALLPYLARIVSRLLKREVVLPRIPASAVWIAASGTGTAWLLYGIAFQLLAHAVGAGHHVASTGVTSAYIAVYTSSYLVGYLALLAPGGIVVREAMLVQGLVALGLATQPSAWLLAIASRVWLTVLEIVPGLLFLGRDALRRPSPTIDDVTL